MTVHPLELYPSFADAGELAAERRGALPPTVIFDTAALQRALCTTALAVIAIGLIGETYVYLVGTETFLKDARHFRLIAERSITSWFESLQMATAAFLLLLAARQTDVAAKSKDRFAWMMLAVIFILMSLDEMVSFHEVSVRPLRDNFDLTGIFHFSWVVIATPLVAIVGLLFIPFLLRLPTTTALLFIASGTVFVGGALGTEFLCGHFAATKGVESPEYVITSAAQESLEILGMAMFLYALLRHLRTARTGIALA